MNTDRPTRDCQHPRANHQHGTRTAYVIDRCRCDDCTKAATAYEKKRRIDHAFGRWDALTDAAPVREHITYLAREGVSYRQVAKYAGVAHTAILDIVVGSTRTGGRPRKRVRRETADRILGMRPSVDVMADGRTYPAAGLIRRVHALAALGYSMTWTCDQAGIRMSDLHRITRTGRTSPGTHLKVDAVYRQVGDTPRVGHTHAEKQSISRTLNRARREKWVPPAGWDDIDLDEAPAVADDRVVSLSERRRQDAVDLIAGGVAPTLVADRLGMSVKNLQRILTTAGREDLAAEVAHAHQVWKDAA